MRPLPNNEIQEKQQVYVKQYPKCESVKQNKGIIREPDASRAKNKKKFRTVGIWPEGRKLPISACDLKQMGVRNRKSQPKPPWSDMKTMKNKYSRAYVIE